MRSLLAIAALLALLAVQPALAQTPTTAPARPTNLVPDVITATSIELRWQDNATDETRYEVARGTVHPDGTLTGQSEGRPPADATGWLDGGLPYDTLRYYNVRACNAAGCSAWSGEIRVRTLAAPTPTPEPTSTPTPTNTPSPTPTDTPTPLPTDTPTPTATATSTPTATPAPCPGVYVGIVVEQNTLTVVCVKPTETAWPDAIEFRGWTAQP